MLYLGEGFKGDECGMGNSDPLILRFFINSLVKLYNIDIKKIKCDLHLRADQNDLQMKKYWSAELGVPLENFRKTSFDKRTEGKATFEDYKGVCIVRTGNVAIQRKLIYLCRAYCAKVIDVQLQSMGD